MNRLDQTESATFCFSFVTHFQSVYISDFFVFAAAVSDCVEAVERYPVLRYGDDSIHHENIPI